VKKIDKNLYINLGFIVFIFVMTIGFLKEYVFQSTSLLSSGVAGLVGAAIGFGLLWLLRGKSIIVKIATLLIYVAIITIVVKFKQNKAQVDPSSNVGSFKGGWITEEEDLVLKLDVNDRSMIMSFQPHDLELVFEYQVQKEFIEFFNGIIEDDFQWEILKLTSDSLVVLENEQVLRFTKSK
jgi:hypothetical protein